MKQSSIQFSQVLVSLLGSLLALLLIGPAARAEPWRAPAACENSFAGAVYFDENRDGLHEASEQYLPGQIALIDAQGATQQTIESQDGVFSVRQLACNTYQVQHNQLTVGLVVVGEVMTQEIKMFPKAQTLFLPVVVAQ